MPGPQAELAGAALLALAVAGCRPPTPAERSVDRYMNCIECMNGELAAVIQFGTQTVPQLRQIIVSGPPASVLDEVRDREDRAFAAIAQSGLDTSGVKNFADLYVSNTIARYQVRAGIALRAIGGTAARQALDQALTVVTLRSDVRDRLMGLRDSTP